MIGIVDVEIQAANPSMPLYPMRAFVGSPSSIRVRNVPKKIGNWQITSVQFTAAYPDNSIKTANCVLVGGVWVGTIAGCNVSGQSINGYSVFASGTDENGNAVNDYCLGKGDITILESDGTITPGENTYYVHMLSAEPTSPKEGDLWNDNGTWYIYQDGTSYPIGDDSGLIQQLSARVDGIETALSGKADKSQLANYELTANMYSDVSSIVLSTETTESWDYQIPQSVVELGYTINSLEYIESEQLWHLDLTIDRESWTWYSNNQQTDTNLTFDEGNAANEFGIIYASWNTTTRNVLGLAMESELSSYELTANMQNDVSAIVLHKTPVEPAQWIWPQMVRAAGNDTYYQESYAHQADWDKTKCYYVPGTVQFDNYLELWHVGAFAYQWEEDSESWEEFAFVAESVEEPYDALTLTVTDQSEAFDTFTLQRVAQNTLGLAMLTDLSSKQDKLSDPQISAIDSVVAERATVITFTDNTTSVFDWSGTITKYTMIDAGLFDGNEDAWIKSPASVKIGTAVTSIGEYAFGFAFNLSSVTIPDSVTSIGNFAFYNCQGLTSVTIPNSVTSIGFDVFDYCTNLSSITVVGKTQAQAEALLLNADVPSGCEITTWNDASQEWVNAQLSTTISQDESNALANYTEDEYKTKVTFNTNTANVYRTQIFDWQGEVNSSMLSDLELSTIEGIKFGKGVSAIADGAFQNIGVSLHEVYFSDSLRRIGISAFAGNTWLYKVVYGDDTPCMKYNGNYAYNKNEGGELSIGDSAFQGCTQLGQAILPDIDKLTVGENVFTGCNFKYNDIVNGQMIHAAGIFFRNFYNKSNLEIRLDAHNLSAEKDAGICHTYIPATVYDVEKAGQDNDSKYLGTYADAKFNVTARGANLSLSAFIVNNVHISADPGSNRTKSINLPLTLTADHSPRSLTVDLSVDAGVTFAGTVNKTTTMDWYLDGTIEQYRNEFLSAGVEVLWKFWEYKPNKWCAKKLGVR